MNPPSGPTTIGMPDLPDAGSSGPDDPRLRGAAQEYLAALESGQRPDRPAFLERFAEIATELAPFLDALDLFHPQPQPLPSTAIRPAVDLPTEPQSLGDFRIVRELGRGGMGIVYEAVQLSLGRRVALKVLPSASAFDSKQLRRFQNEAQAAAQLHHTNIVPVFAVGCERGVHYYAMQLIEGRNLADLIRDMRPEDLDSDATGPAPLAPGSARHDTPPLAALSTQRAAGSPEYYCTVARLAAHAAEALHHAHQYGVIHRDIKPANLMLDRDGQLWVTDFGLAQFHQAPGITQTGDVMGTLRYMSPEQAGGQRALLDARTDVYSLGVTIYELLTLQPMFDDIDHARMLKKILHDEPVPPRQRNPRVPAELETIVLKAVGKAPADRYATAGELAEDLRRFLDHRPILARRPTVVQRLRKWGRRHPSLVIAAALLLILIAAGSLVSAALIEVEKNEKEAAYTRERQRAEEAEARFRLARRSVDDMIQISEEELSDKPYLDTVRRRLLESALVYYQEFIEQRRDDPAAQEELRETKTRVEKILADLALLQGAGQVRLLAEPSVVQDLGLSEEQRSSVAALVEHQGRQWFEAFRDFRQITAEERRERFLDIAREHEARLEKILTRSQRHRLRQIALQGRGPGGFRDPDVVNRLKLTPEQRERIRGIDADTFFGPPPEPRKENGWSGHERKMRAATERCVALLTEEQKRRWQEISGEPFQGALHFMPRFGPPGPPMPGPQPGKPH